MLEKTARLAGLPFAATLLLALAPPVFSQDMPKDHVPTKEELAKDNKLFITLARRVLKWDEPAEPINMVGPLYFIGTRGLSSFLSALRPSSCRLCLYSVSSCFCRPGFLK